MSVGLPAVSGTTPNSSRRPDGAVAVSAGVGPSRFAVVVLSIAIVVAGVAIAVSPFEIGAGGPLVREVECRAPVTEHVLDRWTGTDAAGSILDTRANEFCADAGRHRLAAAGALVVVGLVLGPLTRGHGASATPGSGRGARSERRPTRHRARHDL